MLGEAERVRRPGSNSGRQPRNGAAATAPTWIGFGPRRGNFPLASERCSALMQPFDDLATLDTAVSARGGLSFRAGAKILGSLPTVIVGTERLPKRCRGPASFFKDLSQEGNAPTTTGPCPATFGESTRNLGLFHSRELEQLPTGHAKAQADVGIKFHTRSPRHFPVWLSP